MNEVWNPVFVTDIPPLPPSEPTSSLCEPMSYYVTYIPAGLHNKIHWKEFQFHPGRLRYP